jgi:predicted ATPase/DNA-binding SARP family transcriptional activator
MVSSDPTVAPLVIRLFGPFDVRVNGLPLPRLRSRRGQCLLALLALRDGAEVERDWLAGLLWPESAPGQGLAILRRVLTDLRRVLGPAAGRLRSPAQHSLSLELGGAAVDVTAFDAAIARGGPAALAEAVALYRGPLLEGWVEEWVFQERQVREQAYLRALETLAADARAGGNLAAAEERLRRVAAVDPLREGAQRALMQVFAAGGNYAAAIQVYRDLRQRLHREINAEPDAETQALFEQLRAEARQKAGAGRGRRRDAKRGRITLSSSPPPAPRVPGPILPSLGATVTFLFTDIEGSSRLWEEHPEAMRDALARHEALLLHVIEANEGAVFKTMGDQVCAAFATAPAALAAALAAQRALGGSRVSGVGGREGESSSDTRHPTPYSLLPLKVRMALHTGAAEERDGDYLGPTLNRVARLLAAAHGEQVLLSLAAAELVRDALPEGASLHDLGPHHLKDLSRPEQVFQLVTPDLRADFPPLRSLAAFAHNLPLQLTSFIGREDQMAEVQQLLASHRLVTLTGAGGCGKTRLALQVGAWGAEGGASTHGVAARPAAGVDRWEALRPAPRSGQGAPTEGECESGPGPGAALLPAFPNGIWLVELAPLADPALVPGSVAAALGVRETPGQPLTQTLIEYLKPRQLLLLLDNCEHLIEACARLAAALLRSCPELRILATSREPLAVMGERAYRVPSLSVPGVQAGSTHCVGTPSGVGEDSPERLNARTPERLNQYEAIRLFCERATAVVPAFALTAENAAAVAQVCRRLDGIPLAIELAAARLKALPVETIAARLDDLFRLLTGGSRTALPRHQTLRASIEWSYDLLSEPERTLLRRLSVFAGGWTLEAAEAVCGAGVGGWGLGVGGDECLPTPNAQPPTPSLLDLLTSLVDKSLVQYEERAEGARYRLLETIRQYSREQLLEAGEAAAVQERHCDWCLALAEQAEPELFRAEQKAWLERLEREHDNLRAALAWCGKAVDSGQWLVDSPAELGSKAGVPLSGLTTIHYPLSTAVEKGLRLGGALWRFWDMRGYLGEGREHLAGLLAMPGAEARTAVRARALRGAGWLAQNQADNRAAQALHEEGLAIFRELGDRRGIAWSLTCMVWVAQVQGNYGAAHALGEEGLAIFRELGDRLGMAWSLISLGWTAVDEGDHGAVQVLGEESLAIFRELGDKQSIAWSLNLLGFAAHFPGQYGAARARYQESLAIFRELGHKLGIGYVLARLGHVEHAQGNYETARGHYQESLAIFRETGDKRAIGHGLDGLGRVNHAQGDYGAARALCQESLTIFREIGSKWGIALSLQDLGRIDHAQGVHGASRALLEESLANFREVGNKEFTAHALCDLASATGAQGDCGAARALLEESLAIFQELENEGGLARNLEGWAALAVAQAQFPRAARLFGAAEATREASDAPLPPTERAEYERDVTALRAALGAEALAAAWAEGRAMSLAEAVRVALEG